MSVDLKPCPWCRGAAAIHWRAGAAFAYCEDLGCVGSDLAADPTAWNTRAPEPNQARLEALEAEVERLRSALEPFASLPDAAHGNARYFLQLFICPEGDDPIDSSKHYGPDIRRARAALENRHD